VADIQEKLSPSAGADSRIIWLDIARALGILLVVFGHVERGLLSSGILNDKIWSQIDFIIYTFHMPLFFYLSGLNVMRSRQKPSFFKRRAKALIIPYIVFSILSGGLQALLASHTNNSLSLQDLGLILLYPIPPFWFLYVLLIYTAIVSLWRPGWQMMAIAVLMLLASPLVGISAFPLFKILYFFAFFVAGILFPPPRLSTGVGVSALCICVAYSVMALFLGSSVSSYYALYMLPAAVCGTLGLIYVAQNLEAKAAFWNSWLASIGKKVLAIYVMHIIAAAGTRIILLKMGIDYATVHLLLGLSAGMVLPLVALWSFQRMGVAPYLGFSDK